jgi:hypothetical protein
MARHEVFLIGGWVSMAVTLTSLLTGTCLVKYRGFVFREEDPKEFWQGVAMYCAFGLISFWLYWYTST